MKSLKDCVHQTDLMVQSEIIYHALLPYKKKYLATRKLYSLPHFPLSLSLTPSSGLLSISMLHKLLTYTLIVASQVPIEIIWYTLLT